MRNAIAALLISLGACSGGTNPRGGDSATTNAISIPFRATIGVQAFRCGETYQNVGTTRTTYRVQDLRFYVSDVRLLTSSGQEVPFVLDTTAFQNGNVALLDFENGGSGCPEGNSATNTELRGHPASAGTFVGMRFVLGIPEAQNHLDSATQPSPLNLTGMFWGWAAGYKFLRTEGSTPGLASGHLFHLGNPICVNGAADCIRYRPTITLMGNVTSSAVEADLARLYSTSNLSRDESGAPGCMSDPGDTDCTPILASLGLNSLGLNNGTQTFFALVAR